MISYCYCNFIQISTDLNKFIIFNPRRVITYVHKKSTINIKIMIEDNSAWGYRLYFYYRLLAPLSGINSMH